MTKTIAFTVAVCASIALADAPDFMTLMKAKYERDMKTEEGRRSWHGAAVSRIADPSNNVVVITYADGTKHVEKAKLTTPASSVKDANAKLKRTVDRTGVPKALAEARARRAAERSTVSNATVVVTSGGKR